MKKSSKLLSLLLALVLATSCFTGVAVFSASAAEDTKIYFEFPQDGKWGDPANAKKTVYCHLYAIYGNETDLKETSWQVKAERCTQVSEGFYSFDTASLGVIEDNADYGVIFSTTANGGFQTCDITMTSDCLGDTVYVTEGTRENAVNSQKRDSYGAWKNNPQCGVMAAITSLGEVLDGVFPFYQPKAQKVAQALKEYILNPVNTDYFQTENVLKICDKLGVTPKEVYDQYAADYAELLAAGDEATPTLEQVAERLNYTPAEETTAPETTVPETTVPETTVPETTVPETTVPDSEEDTYIVAGSSEELFGKAWDGENTANQMTKDGDLYTITYVNVQPMNGLQFKVVKNATDWIGDETGNNITINVVEACDVTITINPETNEITVSGDGVVIVKDIEIEKIAAVGNGMGSWLNDVNWDPNADENIMTEVSDGVYKITYEDVEEFDNYQVKFAANGDWVDNWGAAKENFELVIGEEMYATYNGDNITFAVEYEVADVTLTLDLRNFDYATKQGAKMLIEITDKTPDEPKKIYGDVDGDGRVTIEDATIIQAAGVGLVELTDEQKIAADVNGDGRISILDVTYIQKYLAEMPNTALVGQPIEE